MKVYIFFHYPKIYLQKKKAGANNLSFEFRVLERPKTLPFACRPLYRRIISCVLGKHDLEQTLLSSVQCAVDRDNMAQEAQINRNRLDSFFLGHFVKKKCLLFYDSSVKNRVCNFLANMPFLYCKISTFSNQFAKSPITFDGKVPLT